MTFQKRLKACQENGNLTVADLSRWFGREYATVRGWVEDGIEPGGGPGDKQHAQSLLVLLEKLIERRKGFPIPVGLVPKKRVQHMLDVRKMVMP